MVLLQRVDERRCVLFSAAQRTDGVAQRVQLLLVVLVQRGRLFVQPVRGNAELGGSVHSGRANLPLHRLAGVSDDGGVQALIVIVFGDRDVVVELTGNGL